MKNPKNIFLLALSILLITRVDARAQLAGDNIPGDFGVKSGSQAPPGIYAGYLLYNYDTSKIVRNNGNEVNLTNGDISAWAHVPIFSVVSTKKVLGANYGALIIPSIANLAIEAPRVGLQAGSGYGLGDLYMQPLNLGWQTKHADVLTWYGIFAPTGEYSPGGQFNLGKGMWAHELALGSTVYLNAKKTLSVSALGTYEIHTKKKDTDVRVGQMLTIEGGAGVTAKQALTVGMAYYAQWKVTEDTGLGLPPLVDNNLGKNHNFGLGPDVTMVLPLTKDLKKLAILNFRYLWETGTQLDTAGGTVVFSATFKVK
jgi:hypothetical protein